MLIKGINTKHVLLMFSIIKLFTINKKCKIWSWQSVIFITVPWQLILPRAPTTPQPRAWIWPTVLPTSDWKPKNTAWTRYPLSTEAGSRAVKDSQNNPNVPAPKTIVFCPPVCVLLVSIKKRKQRRTTSRYQTFLKPLIYIKPSCSWYAGKLHVGKLSFGKHKMESFLCSHSLWQREHGQPVWRPWLTIDFFLETSADHRDLMTSAESIYYNLADIWGVFRISPWFLIGTRKYALRPQIGIWIFWLLGNRVKFGFPVTGL